MRAMFRSLITCRFGGLLSLVVVAGCPARPDSKTSTTPDAVESIEAESKWRPPGSAHSAAIDFVALGPDGSCALTQDSTGGLRLWTALDGSAEPQLVPSRASTWASVAKQGERWTVFAGDTAGGAHVLSMQANGDSEVLFSVSPFSGPTSGLVLPGGKRFVALYKDQSIRVFDINGAELSKFDERKFKPESIRLTGDGLSIVVMISSPLDAGLFGVEVILLTITDPTGKTTLARSGIPRVIESVVAVHSTTVAVSVDGSEVAGVGGVDGQERVLNIYSLTEDTKPKPLKIKLPGHQVPMLAYVSDHELLVSNSEGGLSWLLDTRTGDARPRTGIPQDFSHQGKVQATGAARQLVGYGTWLFVRDFDTQEHRFLGYRSSQGSGVAISPRGKTVAWAYSGGEVVVENVKSADKRRSVTLENIGAAGAGQTRVRFVDEEHLIRIDAAGEISLLHWPTDTVIATAGVMGNIRSVDYDSAEGLLLIDRHNNDARLFEVSSERIAGPYIIADDSYRMGLLRPAPPSAVVVWTLDGANKLRYYTIEELKQRPTRAEIATSGKELARGQPAPLAIDRAGRHYGVRWNGSQIELFSELAGKQQTKAIPTPNVERILTSPTGDRALVVFNRNGSVSLSMHDAVSLQPQWSYTSGTSHSDISWSENGASVGVAATTGIVVLDAKTGVPLAKRCGIAFQVAKAPPPTAFASVGQRSLCEL